MTVLAPDVASWDAFLRVLSTRRVGTPISSNALRDDLDAAQIPASSRGGCFREGHPVRVHHHLRDERPIHGARSRGSRRLVYILAKRPGVSA
jgi:hypothetical protein